MEWPNDADGNVLRRIAASGFDFSKPCKIDFQIDFASWPPSPEAILTLQSRYQDCETFEPEDGIKGYIQVSAFNAVTYEFVTQTQRKISELLAPYGGLCEAWGILH